MIFASMNIISALPKLLKRSLNVKKAIFWGKPFDELTLKNKKAHLTFNFLT